MGDMATGTVTPLWNIWEPTDSGTSMHISGKAFNRPGWVVVSTYGEKGGLNWYRNKVFVVELKADPKILNLAHDHWSIGGGYWAEPHVSTNRELTKVLFNSNWRDGTENVDAYLIELPADAVQ